MADYVREFAGGVVAMIICEDDYLYGTQLDRERALAESYDPDEGGYHFEEDFEESDDSVDEDLEPFDDGSDDCPYWDDELD